MIFKHRAHRFIFSSKIVSSSRNLCRNGCVDFKALTACPVLCSWHFENTCSIDHLFLKCTLLEQSLRKVLRNRVHPGPQKPWKSINFSIQNLSPQKSLNFTKSRQGPWKVLKFSLPTAHCRFHFVCFWIATVYWKIKFAAWLVLFSSIDWRRTELAPKTFSKEIKLKLALQTMYNVLCFHPLFWLSQSPTCIEPRA